MGTNETHDRAARAVYATLYPDAPEMFDHPELRLERNQARRLAEAANAELGARIEAAKDILNTHFNQPRFVGTTTLDTVTHAIWELNGRPET